MFGINIDRNTLICVAIIAFVVLIAFVFIFIAYMCHDKRRFDSINEYNKLALDKTKTYNESLEGYNQNIEESGVKTDKKMKFNKILGIAKFLKRDSA